MSGAGLRYGGGGGQDLALYAQAPQFDAGATLMEAQRLRDAQTQGQIQGADLQSLQTRNTEQSMALQDQLIANAARAAAAAPQGKEADAWDAAMQDAVAKGATGARQYIGRYSPLLQSRVAQSYGAGPAAGGGAGLAEARSQQGGAGGGTDMLSFSPDMLDRQFATVSPQQMQQTLQNLNMAADALQRVHDGPSWDAEVRQLAAAGLPHASALIGQFDPRQVPVMYQRVKALQGYLQNRLMNTDMGVPAPLMPNEYKETSGGGMYAVNPFGAPGAAEVVAPTQKSQFVGTTPDGKPIILDTRTGGTMVDGQPYNGAITAKPSATASAWNMKRDAYLAIHPGDYDGAMAVANGQKDLSPAERRRAAIELAQKDYQNETLTGGQIANPNAYIQQKTADYYAQLSGARGSPGQSGGGAGPSAPSAPAIRPAPAGAVAYLRAHPNLRADFDAKYGKGAAARVLGK